MFDQGFEFWHRLLGLFSTYDDYNKIHWAALWVAFDQQAEYINNQAEIETTNKLLESSYDLYKARLWVLDLDSKNQTQQDEVRSSRQEVANLKAENGKSQQVIDELQAKLKEMNATQELSGVLDAWEDRAQKTDCSLHKSLILIGAMIASLFAGALYVIVCVGFGWLDALLIPDGCVNLGDNVCVGLTQRTAFLTVIFLTVASVIFLVLRILLRGIIRTYFGRMMHVNALLLRLCTSTCWAMRGRAKKQLIMRVLYMKRCSVPRIQNYLLRMFLRAFLS